MNKRSRTLLMAAGVAAWFSASAMAADEHTAGQVLDDTLVTTKVKAALVRDPITKAHQISVDTYKGTVKLSGFVDSSEAERRAVELARATEGAVKVDDGLSIRK